MAIKIFLPEGASAPSGSWEEKGVSLIEILVSVTLLIVIVIGGASFFFYSNTKVSEARNYRLALELAQEKLEELKGKNFSEIGSEEEIFLNNFSFLRTTLVESMDEDGGGVDYKKVEVKVSWIQTSGEGEVKLATLIGLK